MFHCRTAAEGTQRNVVDRRTDVLPLGVTPSGDVAVRAAALLCGGGFQPTVDEGSVIHLVVRLLACRPQSNARARSTRLA